MQKVCFENAFFSLRKCILLLRKAGASFAETEPDPLAEQEQEPRAQQTHRRQWGHQQPGLLQFLQELRGLQGLRARIFLRGRPQAQVPPVRGCAQGGSLPEEEEGVEGSGEPPIGAVGSTRPSTPEEPETPRRSADPAAVEILRSKNADVAPRTTVAKPAGAIPPPAQPTKREAAVLA